MSLAPVGAGPQHREIASKLCCRLAARFLRMGGGQGEAGKGWNWTGGGRPRGLAGGCGWRQSLLPDPLPLTWTSLVQAQAGTKAVRNAMRAPMRALPHSPETCGKEHQQDWTEVGLSINHFRWPHEWAAPDRNTGRVSLIQNVWDQKGFGFQVGFFPKC